MWQLEYNNPICNHREKSIEQQQHAERIYSAKGKTDTKAPIKPSFLIYKAKKIDMEEVEQDKINYENFNLLKKIIDAELKPSKYSMCNLVPSYCPALDFKRNLRFYKKEKEFEKNKSTFNLYCKIDNIKSHYCPKKLYVKGEENAKIANRIKRDPKVLHPYLCFQSPKQLMKKMEMAVGGPLKNSEIHRLCRSNSTGNFGVYDNDNEENDKENERRESKGDKEKKQRQRPKSAMGKRTPSEHSFKK